MIVAVEDPLSEVVIRKLVATLRPEITVSHVIRKSGKSYLRSKAAELNRTARSLPVFLLVDQDTPAPCPPELVATWVPNPSALLFFRVAVMEVESWVLAHRSAVAAWLRVPESRIPGATDTIPDPKQFLVNLARRSRSRDLREDLVPAQGATSAVGPAYNPRLAEFVANTWDPRIGASVSHSLQRTTTRLQELRIN